MKIFSTSLTLIASAFIGPNKATATYINVGGLKGGYCADSQQKFYTAVTSPLYGQGGSVSNPCIILDDAAALNVCEIYCDVNRPSNYIGLEVVKYATGPVAGCFVCDCLFDDPNGATISSATLQLYTPAAREFNIYLGTGPVTSSKTGIIDASCYKYIAPTPAPTRKPIATTSAPTRKPIATTSAPTRKPTAAGSKSSKGVKATKGPASAKSSKNAKRG